MLGTPPQPCGWPLPSGSRDCGKDHPLLPLRPCPPRRGGRAHRRDSEKSDRRTGQPLRVRDQQTSCCSPTAWFGANFITSLHLSVSNPKTRNGNYLYGCHEDKMLLLRDACAHKSTLSVTKDDDNYHQCSELHCPSSNRDGGVQLPSRVRLFATPWTAACQASQSSTISWSLHKFKSTELVMLPNHLIFCCPFFLCLPSFPALGSLPVRRHFVPGGHSIGASASASALPVNIQGCSGCSPSWTSLVVTKGPVKPNEAVIHALCDRQVAEESSTKHGPLEEGMRTSLVFLP